MKFAALDVETANRHRRSICQVAVVVFEDGREIAGDVVLVDPEDEFEAMNRSIHGIGPDDVKGAMIFPSVHARLHPILAGLFVISHHTFDPVAIRQACERYQLDDFGCRWVDSCAAARKAWPELKERGGHGLRNLATHFGIPLVHHDALEDARVAGMLMMKAIAETGVDLDGWLGAQKRSPAASYAGSRGSLRREGDGDGPLMDECIVFTGNFSVDKFDLADMAHIAGAAVRERVTRETTMLVVGAQDRRVVGSTGKSSNQRQAEKLVAEGRPLLIVTEMDFRELIRGPGGYA